jgi:UDP-2-acetamido-2,6-beta-L-arabino-hexul-4-ose reductase
LSVVLVTGSQGFIGRNLCVRLHEHGEHEVIEIGRGDGADALASAANRADFVFHVAGVNRPLEDSEFVSGNVDFTAGVCAAMMAAGNRAPIVYASSVKAVLDNAYGRSKREAETVLLDHAAASGAPVYLFRLPNVFGKWARPNYNSAVATFCHNVARGEPISVHDAAARLDLAYVDDVVETFIGLMSGAREPGYCELDTVYSTTVGEVAEIIRRFPRSRETLISPPVGKGLTRALYSTYLSHLPVEDFSYGVPVHADARGVFVEMLKTPDTGQFSYFTSHPGVTRGDHYHHSKAEKFLVLSGTAHFAFRHIVTGETHDLTVGAGEARVVETIPGWTHNITNVGEQELVVMLWANEIFDRDHPDTIALKV